MNIVIQQYIVIIGGTDDRYRIYKEREKTGTLRFLNIENTILL